ncbi:Ribonuclease H [Methylocella silvestris BL2]|uniref:Ribonuclease HII n=1 Tax=Methylocella silvestris (strain DSM 15510 / CIP 108128 / LMG 27833 / NCIMB 13906 / BL2) TaxID=395965 RepID=B8EI63_METSB|nr:ribonuclease HII [Methylocella silvestris]ACK50545.1 Ribonuclease H [Methylocella silvestris BL2]
MAEKPILDRPDFRLERKLLRRDVWPVAGVDEAGRGPLAGPVAAAAVILDPDNLPRGLNDSKQLTREEREKLYESIMKRALAVAVGFSSVKEIDAVNIRQATFRAMRRALAALAASPRYVLIDGNDLAPDLCCEGETIVKGDASILSIAAASIVAKVTRDRLMSRLCAVHPVYGFSQHVGYGTPAHLQAIEAHGPCPFHRLTFRPFRAD